MVIIDPSDLRARLRRRLMVGFLTGVAVMLALSANPLQVEVIDPRMEAACKFPTHEGEFLWAIVLNNRLVCGVYK